MNLPSEINKINAAAEYLAREEVNDYRSEFLNGEITAMAGGKPAHNRIGYNIGGELHARFKGKMCEGFGPDQQIKVGVANAYLYPDIFVACPAQFDASDGRLINPTVIFEVLSPSTAFRDRVEKWDAYRLLPSLQEYLLVNQHEPHIIQSTRQGETWVVQYVAGLESSITLTSLGITLPLADIYARVNFADAEK